MSTNFAIHPNLMGGLRFARKPVTKPSNDDINEIGDDAISNKKLPEELDFFKSEVREEEVQSSKKTKEKKLTPKTENSKSKKKSKKNKRKKGENEEIVTKSKKIKEDDSDSDDDEEQEQSISLVNTSEKKTVKRSKKAGKGIQHEEKMAQFRNKNKIYVTGVDIPDVIESFEDIQNRFEIESYLLKNLRNAGFTTPTAIQMQAIPYFFEKREIIACAPTGSGKTLAFVLPLFALLQKPSNVGFRAAIIAPTKELARQIYNVSQMVSEGRKWKIHLLTKATASKNSFGPQASKKLDILISTPMRLVHMLSLGHMRLDSVEWLIMDEADKLWELGFLSQIDEILASCTHPKIKRVLFSATIPQKVQEMANTILKNPSSIFIGGRNVATDTIKQELRYVGREDGKLIAIRQIFKDGVQPPVVIFVQSVDRAKQLFHELVYDGINVDVIHSERTQLQRDQIIRKFRTGDIWVLIATDVLGRGMDFKGVNVVINYDFPTTVASYIHRIGRTGRAGRQGTAITLFTDDDRMNLKSIVNVVKDSGNDVPQWMLDIRKPSKKIRRMMEKRPIEREDITTIPGQRRKRKPNNHMQKKSNAKQ